MSTWRGIDQEKGEEKEGHQECMMTLLMRRKIHGLFSLSIFCVFGFGFPITIHFPLLDIIFKKDSSKFIQSLSRPAILYFQASVHT